MPNRWAVATGNWSSTATWNNGAVLGIPTGSDDVFISGSSVVVTIDQDISVLSLNTFTTGSIALGNNSKYSIASSRNINAGIIRGNNAVPNVSTIDITGTGILVNITGSIQGIQAGGVGVTINITTTTSTINISGSVTAIASNGAVVSIAGTSTTVNITGNLLGGNSNTGGAVSLVVTNNNLILIGNMTSGATSNALTISATSPFTASIIGNTINTTGITPLSISSTGLGTVTMTGSINGGIGSSWIGASISATNLTFNFTGSINGGGAGGTSATGLNYSSGGTNSILNIAGSINIGAGGSGLVNQGAATVNIIG